jgi:hypothetical protein
MHLILDEIPTTHPRMANGAPWPVRLILDNEVRAVYGETETDLVRCLIEDYPSASAALTVGTIEAMAAARRRWAVRYATRTQAVVLASLLAEDIFDVTRASMWARIALTERRDLPPQRVVRLWASTVPLVLVASNYRPWTDRPVTLGATVVMIDDSDDESLLRSCASTAGWRIDRVFSRS